MNKYGIIQSRLFPCWQIIYDRLPTESGLQDINDNADGRLQQWRDMANFDDAMWSGQSNEDWRNNIPNYNIDSWQLWNFSFIRDINLSLENMQKYGTKLNDAQKSQFSAELRFLRAFDYFELVKRMGVCR